tara:strand:- start:614 stop:1798 length:1185 start_codon:yes stop_codon:yes gene_type:complete
MDLSYQDIISNSFKDHTKKTLTNGEEFTYYIDKTIGWKSLARYPVLPYGIIKTDDIIINNKGHDSSKQEFIRSTFNKLDKIIDLDFQEMTHNNGSMLDIYHVNSSSSFSEYEDNVIGQALPQRSEFGSWWDILWKDSLLGGLTNLDSNLNTIIHEIGHTLGLAHPHDDPRNISFNSEKTIMSYNKGPEGWNSWFSKVDINALISIWGREDDLGIINFDNNSSDFKYHRIADGQFSIKTEIGHEDITEITTINFLDRSVNVKDDIIEVFNQIKGIDDISGKIYRLYNATFARFPDQEGLKYWIKNNTSGIDTYRSTAASFLISEEFISIYGIHTTNEDYIKSLYTNVLERQPDLTGYNYWLNQINTGLENRGELLMGFSESTENKQIFSSETNFF